MLLRDLLRYRTQNHEHTEDYASAALTALWAHDPEARLPILRVFHGGSWSPQSDLSDATLRHQVRVERWGVVLQPDLVVNARGWSGIIECKIKDRPKAAQLQSYAGLGVNQVALLAPADRLPAPSDPEFIGFARGSWEDLWRALVELPAPQSAIAAYLRAAFCDLLEELKLTRERALPRGEVWRGSLAFQNLQAASELLRAGTLALRPSLGVSPKEPAAAASPKDAVWEEGEPLSASWTQEKVKKSVAIRGLGLSADLPEGVGGGALTWTLWLRPGPALKRKAIRKVRWGEQAWEEGEDGWFYVPLSMPLGARPDQGAAQDLEQAVAAGRAWLKLTVKPAGSYTPAPFHLRRGATEPAPLRDLAQDLKTARRTAGAMSQWADRCFEQLGDALEARFPSAEIEPKRDYIYISESGRRRMWLSTGWRLYPRPSLLYIWVGWDLKAHRGCAERFEQAWTEREGFKLKRSGGAVRVRVKLTRVPASEATPALVNAVVEALAKDAALLPPFAGL